MGMIWYGYDMVWVWAPFVRIGREYIHILGESVGKFAEVPPEGTQEN